MPGQLLRKAEPRSQRCRRDLSGPRFGEGCAGAASQLSQIGGFNISLSHGDPATPQEPHGEVRRNASSVGPLVEPKLGYWVLKPMSDAAPNTPLHTALALIKEAQAARVRAHVRSMLLQVGKRPQACLQKAA